MTISAQAGPFLLPVYPMTDIELVRGKGCQVWDSNGKEYLDLTSAQGVTNAGHCNEYVNEAIQRQLNQLTNHYNSFHHSLRAQLAESLSQIAPHGLARSFFCNSGTEAVEAALKFARASTGKKNVIAFSNGFHGRTMGALSATWKKEFRAPFEPLLEGFSHVPYNNIDAFESAITSQTGTVILELVQGEGGVIPAQHDFVQTLYEICRSKDILLIVDEVQTGFGRTGKMFACEHYGISPDLLCLAKAMANGFPMGGVLANEKIRAEKKSHGSTFGGNPVACAASIATIAYIQKNHLVENARERGNYFLHELQKMTSPLIRDTRGLGLMLGIELRQHSAPYLKQLSQRHVLALPAGATMIRALPPLIITRNEINQALEALREILA